MVVYKGDPDVVLSRVASLAAGDLANVSRLDFGVHTGTHVDAPVHFIEGAPGAEDIPLAALVGPARVVDATGFVTDINESAMRGLDIPDGTERLLLKTRNSRLWEKSDFSAGFSGLTEDAAHHVVGLGVRLVGIDYLSIAPHADPAPTHVALLQAGVVILEGLDLRGVDPGEYTLVCLPLRLVGADGAPARAVLLRP